MNVKIDETSSLEWASVLAIEHVARPCAAESLRVLIHKHHATDFEAASVNAAASLSSF